MNFSVQRVYAVLLRILYLQRRSPMRITEMFYYPALDIALWCFTSKWLQSGNTTSMLVALATNLVLWQVVWRANSDISITMVEELWNRGMTNFFGSPLTLTEWMVAVMFSGIATLIVIIPYTMTIIWSIYGINIFDLGPMMLIYMLLLLCSGWALGFLMTSIIIYFGRRAQSLPWMSFVFVPISAVYYPLETLPKFLQKVALCIPMTHIFEAIRHHIFTGTVAWAQLGRGAVMTGLLLFLAIVIFRTSFSKALKRGLASLE